MAAANTDKFRKKKNLFSTTLNGGIESDSTSLTCNSLSGVPTDTAVTMTIDRVDANGTSTPTKREDFTGVVSGSNVTNLLRGEGATTAQAHANGAVVEITWETETWNDAVDGILVGHNQDGTHKSGSVLTLPQINDTSSDHQYVFAVSELAADRTVTLPILTGNDEFVFKDEAQTLTNKTLTSPTINTPTITGLSASGAALTSPKITTGINDADNNELIKVTATASAVNEITLANAATTANPTITASGGDDNISILIAGKGTGGVKIGSGTVAATDILDEDTMSSDSATALATQQSIKAYVDTAAAARDKARAYRNGSQTISNNTFTKIQLNAESYDVGSRFDSTTNYRFVAGSTGYYLVVANIHWASSADQKNYQIHIYVNNATHAQQILHTSGTGDFNQSISDIVYLETNGYVELFGFQNSGGDINVGGGDSSRTYMSVAKLL